MLPQPPSLATFLCFAVSFALRQPPRLWQSGGRRAPSGVMASSRPPRDPKARANLLSQETRGNAAETNRTADLDNLGVINLQRQMMKDQDDELAGLESTVLSTKHIALAVNEELDLHTRLLDDIDQDADATNNHLKTALRRATDMNQRASKGCSMMVMCVLVLVIVFLLLLAIKLLRF